MYVLIRCGFLVEIRFLMALVLVQDFEYTYIDKTSYLYALNISSFKNPTESLGSI